VKTIEALIHFLATGPGLLRRVWRWTHADDLPHDERETVETHSLASVWLMGALLAIEERSGRHALHPARLLLAASLHDVGEGKMGDIGYPVKNDPRAKDILREIERELVENLFRDFPEDVRAAYLDAYAVESESETTLDGRFFNAAERLGYVLFAIPQIKKGRLSFIQLLHRQNDPLLRHVAEFDSIRTFYEPHREFIQQKLKKASG
jgi:5'-deoxynucleotidase YfbR-like HD superfamily hydrolase